VYRQPSYAKLGPRTGVTGAVSPSDLEFVEGGGAAGRRGLRLGSAVYLIGWRIERGNNSFHKLRYISSLT